MDKYYIPLYSYVCTKCTKNHIKDATEEKFDNYIEVLLNIISILLLWVRHYLQVKHVDEDKPILLLRQLASYAYPLF
jgi:hypothetical protein